MNISALKGRAGLPTLTLLATFCTAALAVETERVNISIGTPEAQESDFPSVSYDANRVVFESRQPGLVPGDTNSAHDIFLFERRSKAIRRISVSSAGNQATGPSFDPEISGNGQFVVYRSNASDLVANDTNEAFDVFRFDTNTGATELISVNLAGVSGTGSSREPDITTDGSVVVFDSNATDLVLQDTNETTDVFIRDLDDGVTERILGLNGAQLNGGSASASVSENGRFIAFQSLATNLVNDAVGTSVNIYLHDRVTGDSTLVSRGIDGPANNRSLDPVISRQGRYVAFSSTATNLVEGDTNSSEDVFRFDRFTKKLERVTTNFEGGEATFGGGAAFLSDRGEFVTFVSSSSDILASPTVSTNAVYQKDMRNGEVKLVSLATNEELPDAGSFRPATDRLGRYVAYASLASNLDGQDLNPLEDVYLTDQGALCDVASAVNRKTVESDQWVQLSLPCQPPEGVTVSDLFGDDIDGVYGTDWIVFTYDVSTSPTGTYNNPGADGTLSAGVGFWFRQNTGSAVTLDLPEGSRGLASSFDEGAACISGIGCRSAELSASVPGAIKWQMMGNPFQQSRILAVYNLRVKSSSGTCSQSIGCTLGAASGANLVSSILYSYDGVEYDTLGTNDTLDAWTGFWLGELPGADSNEARIIYAEGPISSQ